MELVNKSTFDDILIIWPAPGYILDILKKVIFYFQVDTYFLNR